MMLTIHGLPRYINFQELKAIITKECNINDFILDNFVNDENGLKKIRIGVADESEGAVLMRYLDCYSLSGHQLRVTPVGKAPLLNTPRQAQFETRNEYNSQTLGSVDSRPGFPIPNTNVQQSYAYQQQSPAIQEPQSQHNVYSQQPLKEARHYNQQEPFVQGRMPGSQCDTTYGLSQNKQMQNPSVSFGSRKTKPADQRNNNLRSVEIIDTSYVSLHRNAPSGKNFATHSPTQVYSHGGQVKNKPLPNFTRDDFNQGRSAGQAYPFAGSVNQPSPADYPGPSNDSRSSSWTQQSNPSQKIAIAPFSKQSPNTFNDGQMYNEDDRKFGQHQPTSKKQPYLLKQPTTEMPSQRYQPHQTIPETGRRQSPQASPGRYSPRRRISPRAASPTGRRFSPGRTSRPAPSRMSPGKRSMPPSSGYQDRRVSPRRHSPRRHRSPGKRLVSPRRMSPGGMKRQSPSRKFSPSINKPTSHQLSGRYSPTKVFLDKGKRNEVPPLTEKARVKSSYEDYQATSNEAKYRDDYTATGAYRSSIGHHSEANENWKRDAYPSSLIRKEEFPSHQHRQPPSHQQHHKESTADLMKRPLLHSPTRRSRSPMRRLRSPPRNRSPARDAMRRYSPASQSPKRSWANEKPRPRSPIAHEAPPPPSWPGQPDRRREFINPQDNSDRSRPHPKMNPIWKEPQFEERKSRFDVLPARREELISSSQTSKMSKFDISKDNIRDAVPPRPERREYREEPTHQVEWKTRSDDRYSPSIIEDKFNNRDEFIDRRDQPYHQEEVPHRHRRADALPMQEHYANTRRLEEFTRENEDGGNRNPRHRERSERSPEDFHSRSEFLRKEKISRAIENIQSTVYQTMQKRERATEEISKKIISRNIGRIRVEIHKQISLEVKKTITGIIDSMLGDREMPFKEILFKYRLRYSEEDEDRMFDSIVSRHGGGTSRKRQAEGSPPRERKTSKTIFQNQIDDLKYHGKKMEQIPPNEPAKIPKWYKVEEPEEQSFTSVEPVNLPIFAPPVIPYDPINSINPLYSMNPYVNMVPIMTQEQHFVRRSRFDIPPSSIGTECNLFLYKQDSAAINVDEAVILKDFLVSQIFEATAAPDNSGWAPTLTLKGLQNNMYYEVRAEDDLSRDWLINFDFSSFAPFQVLVYTQEELWFERAAIWLPGHSKSNKKYEPLTKLRMQNSRLEGVDLGKWKLVKKIVTLKGTRIYVDMPSTAARALEKYNMLLSYELQKVNVFLKSVAVDKEAFDLGLNEESVTDEMKLGNFIAHSQLPILNYETNVVRICLSDDKLLCPQRAKKVKEVLIFNIYRSHQRREGNRSTDFIKFGFCQPGYLAVLPENKETTNWLMSLRLPKFNRREHISIFSQDISDNSFTFLANLPSAYTERKADVILDKLMESNKRVNGLNISKWKVKFFKCDHNGSNIGINVDLESAETLYNMDFTLYYCDSLVTFSHNYDNIKEIIETYKSEMIDVYDATNMDLASDDEN